MKHSRERAATVAAHTFLGTVLVLSLGPVLWALVSAFKPPAQIVADPLGLDLSALTLENFRRVFEDVPLLSGFVNTAVVLLSKGTLTLLLAPLAAFGFAKYRFPGRSLLFGAVLVTLMLPTIVLIIPLLLQMKELGWVNTYQALILPGAVDAFAIFWMRQVITEIPDELLDAARIDGCGELGIFTRVVMPLIRPALAGLGVLTVMNIYNDFVWPVVVANSERMATLQVVLSTLAQNITGNRIGADYATVTGELLAAASIAMLPLVVIFIALQRHFVNGILAGSVKG